MDWQQHLLETALLGTDKRQVSNETLPPALNEVAAGITTTDQEEYFLQVASLAFNFRQCGAMPASREKLIGGNDPSPVSKADTEVQPYCTAQSMLVLKDILEEENMALLQFWLEQCAIKEQLVQPDLLPEILSAAVQYKKLQPLTAACAGKRGEWLSRFNPLWNFSVVTSLEELWQTGNPEQRKQALRTWRASDPSLGREWLVQTWPQEDANTKTDLLGILTSRISESDIAFLEGLSTEKSKKVKDLALKLLKLIPTSSIVQQYQQVLQQAVVLKREKSMLGILSKVSLQLALPAAIDDVVFKSGIEKLSNSKGLTDDEFVIYQLAQVVPPAFWEQQLGYEPGGVIELLKVDRSGQKLLPAIVSSIVTQADARWAEAIMDYCMEEGSAFYAEIIPLLPAKLREGYMLQFFDGYPDIIIDQATRLQELWSTELSRRIFQHTAKNHYQYNRSFYSQYIRHIPAAIQQELHLFAPEQEYLRSVWNNTSALISQLLQLKIRTVQSFNALK